MIIKSKTLAILVISILFGGILISSGLGWWKTESSKVAATFKDGEFAGQANPADIRGSYTFGDIEKNFDVPAATLGQAFNVNTSPEAFQVKSLEGTAAENGVEIGTASVRLFVAFYKDLPFDLSTDIYLPESAAAILKARSLAPEQLAYLDLHTVVLSGAGSTPAPVIQETPGAAVPSTLTSATERMIKGKTTFGELLSWGLPQKSIEQILGLQMPNTPSTTLKDFCTNNNLVFETIKTTLQVEVDKLK
jgi:hypothetical protein